MASCCFTVLLVHSSSQCLYFCQAPMTSNWMPVLLSASQPPWWTCSVAVGLSHMLSSVSQSANVRTDSRQWRDGKNTNSVQSPSPDSVIFFLCNLPQVTKSPHTLVFIWKLGKWYLIYGENQVGWYTWNQFLKGKPYTNESCLVSSFFLWSAG